VNKYLVLIYGDEQVWDAASDEWGAENERRHGEFAAEAGDALLGGFELQRTSAALSIRVGDAGAPQVTDGPFLESKEVVGGYYLVQAPNIVEAARLASLIPEASAAVGGVEIRPVLMSEGSAS
jgi:hypothetical protein